MKKPFISLVLIVLILANHSHCDKNPSGRHWYGNYEKRFTIEIDNPSGQRLDDRPFILKTDEIRKNIADFNPKKFVLVRDVSNSTIVKIIPSQSDDLDGDGLADELVFVHSIDPEAKEKIFCYYSPEGDSIPVYPEKADARLNWTARERELGWESNWCGYSFFDGRMDFYAKRLEGLQLKRFVTKTNYHKLNDWGMDVLIIHDKPGLGSIILWNGDDYVSTVGNSEENKIHYKRKIISTGPVRALVRVDMENIHVNGQKYHVTMSMSAFADNSFSRQEVSITTDGPDSVVFSPGIQKLSDDAWRLDETAGIFSCWGNMNEQIGDIGLGLIFPAAVYAGFAKDEAGCYVKLKVPAGEKITCYTIGGWEKGADVPPVRNETDWHKKVVYLSLKLNIVLKDLVIHTNK